MFNLDDITNENNKYNLKWPYIPDHPYRMLIIGDSGSRQTTALLISVKMYFQVFSFASKKVQRFSSDRKILMSFLSVLFHRENAPSVF